MKLRSFSFVSLLTTILSLFIVNTTLNGEETSNTVTESKILNLEECLREGLNNYQSIKVAEFDKIWAEAKLSEAKTARFLPEFKATNLFGPIPDLPSGYGPPNFNSFDTDFSNWNIFYRVKVEAFQPLYTFGKISNLINAAMNGVEAKNLQIEIEKRDLAHKIKSVYFGLVFGYASLALMDEVKDKIDAAIKKISKLLAKNSSEVTELDLLKLRVFDADLKKRYIDVQSDIDTGKRALMVLLGKEPNHGIETKDKNLFALSADVKDIEEYYKLAKEKRGELKQILAAVDIRKSLMVSAKSDFFPVLFIAGQFEYGVAPGRVNLDNPYLYDRFNTLTAGGALGLSFNLNYALTNTRYRQAKAEYNKLLVQTEMVNNAVMLEVRDSYQDMVSNKDAMEVARAGFKDARSWMTAAYLSFDMGTVNTKDLIEAFVAYTKTKMEYFNTIFSYNMALSKLTRATGSEASKISY